MRPLSIAALARLLLLFWALYFTVVALSNLTDLLEAIHLLPSTWFWVSGNLGFIASGTVKLGAPSWLNGILLAGVIAWEAAAAALFWRALGRPRDEAAVVPPFVVSLALWAIFIVLDEVLLIFATGAEATHLRLFTAELLTLIALRLLLPR
jgi:hypothetical protein